MHLIVIWRVLALFNYIIWLLWPAILGSSLCFACLLLLFQELLQFHFGHLWEWFDPIEIQSFVHVADSGLELKELFIGHVVWVYFPSIEADFVLSFICNVVLVKTHIIKLQHSFSPDSRSCKSYQMASTDPNVADYLLPRLHALANRYTRHIAGGAYTSGSPTLDMPIGWTHVKLARCLPCEARIVMESIVESDIVGLVDGAHVRLASLVQLLDWILVGDAQQVLRVLLTQQQLLLIRSISVSALHSILVLLAHEYLIVVYGQLVSMIWGTVDLS